MISSSLLAGLFARSKQNLYGKFCKIVSTVQIEVIQMGFREQKRIRRPDAQDEVTENVYQMVNAAAGTSAFDLEPI